MMTNIEIANRANLKPILEIAGEKLGIPSEAIDLYGRYKAKIPWDYINSLQDQPNGKLILVTAMTPTTAGEGKTTTLIGLTDALNRIGKKNYCSHSGTKLGTLFWNEGRGLRRWLRPNCPDDGY